MPLDSASRNFRCARSPRARISFGMPAAAVTAAAGSWELLLLASLVACKMSPPSPKPPPPLSAVPESPRERARRADWDGAEGDPHEDQEVVDDSRGSGGGGSTTPRFSTGPLLFVAVIAGSSTVPREVEKVAGRGESGGEALDVLALATAASPPPAAEAAALPLRPSGCTAPPAPWPRRPSPPSAAAAVPSEPELRHRAPVPALGVPLSTRSCPGRARTHIAFGRCAPSA
mmetsp:Transcript_136262/g.435960  ORF Transcript_136262/g.435960 Transcript_136262/m.435960 type:complete len:230 (+) Transcript_136262:5655-6344(+)